MTDPVMLLSQVHGEGRITYRALTEAGFNTLEAIAAARTEVLSDRAFLSPATAGRLKAGASEMLTRPVAPASPGSDAGAPPRIAQSQRIAGRRSSAELRFSAGIGSVEASMLGQGGPTGVLPHPPDSPHPDRIEEKPLRADPHYAAFLPEAPAAVADRSEKENHPPRPRSFWSFGAGHGTS